MRESVHLEKSPIARAFRCSRRCHRRAECTHWEVHESQCNLKMDVIGRRLNEDVQLSGNRACSLGTLGIGTGQVTTVKIGALRFGCPRGQNTILLV